MRQTNGNGTTKRRTNASMAELIHEMDDLGGLERPACIVPVMLPRVIVEQGCSVEFCATGEWDIGTGGDYSLECPTCRGFVRTIGAAPGFCPWCGSPVDHEKATFHHEKD